MNSEINLRFTIASAKTSGSARPETPGSRSAEGPNGRLRSRRDGGSSRCPAVNPYREGGACAPLRAELPEGPDRRNARPPGAVVRWPCGHPGDQPRGRTARRERLEVSHLVERVEGLEGRRAAARWPSTAFLRQVSQCKTGGRNGYLSHG
jgi:hypothetical protein